MVYIRGRGGKKGTSGSVRLHSSRAIRVSATLVSECSSAGGRLCVVVSECE